MQHKCLYLISFFLLFISYSAEAQSVCNRLEFDDLNDGDSFPVGAVFETEGFFVEVDGFSESAGPCTPSPGVGGDALLDNFQGACGTGNEFFLNNVKLKFSWPAPVNQVSFRYFFLGGLTSLTINGDCADVGPFELLNGAMLGGVEIYADVNDNAGCGIVLLTGNVNELSIGGQELVIDDLSYCETCDDQIMGDFDDLDPTIDYVTGDIFTTGNATFELTTFYDLQNCTAPNTGGIDISNFGCNGSQSAFSGRANLNLQSGGSSFSYVVFDFSFASEPNLIINGDCFTNIDYELMPPSIGGVDTWVIKSDFCGRVYTSGTIDEIEFGGEETTFDNIYACTACNEVACQATTKNFICIGDTLFLMESGGEAVAWEWNTNGPGVFNDPTLQNPFVVGAQNGDEFSVIVTDANGCTSNCFTSIAVENLPECIASNNGPICEGEPLQLMENGANVSAFYAWSTNGSGVFDDPTLQNPTVTGAQNGDEFTVVITSEAGCVDSCTTIAEVLEAPACNATNNGPICTGAPLILMEDGGEATAWQWSTDGTGVFDDPNAASPTVSGASDGETFTVVISTAIGCTATCSTTVSISDDLEVAPDFDGACIGDDLLLFSNASAGEPPYSYNWEGPDAFTSNVANPVLFDVGALAAGTYNLTVTDNNGCTATGTATITLLDNVTDPGAIEGNEYLCGPGLDPGPITSVSLPSGGSGPIEYLWMQSTGGGVWEIIPGATGTTYDPGPIAQTTLYTRCVRVEGCISVLETNNVTKTVGSEAIAEIQGPELACVDEEELFIVSQQAGATYFWDFGPNANPATSTDPVVNVTWSSLGLRTVEVSVTTATCTAFATQEVLVTNSSAYCSNFTTNPGESPAELKAYPNPFEDQLQLQLNQVLDQPAPIELIDLNGRRIQTYWMPAGFSTTTLDLAELSSGIYFIQMRLESGEILHQKLIKE